jgi:hypothetical protein
MKKRAKSPSVKRELLAFDKRVVDYAKLKVDISAADIVKLIGPQTGIVVSNAPIETLSPTKTLGKGRTNLTFVRPTIVQIDTTTPFATFDVRAQSSPAISMHFEPIAYGITSVATYLMEFTVQAFGPSTLVLGGFAGSGTLVNTGPKALNGLTTVSLVMRNVPPSQHTNGFLQQTAGVAWNFLSVRVKFPDIVIKQLGG